MSCSHGVSKQAVCVFCDRETKKRTKDRALQVLSILGRILADQSELRDLLEGETGYRLRQIYNRYLTGKLTEAELSDVLRDEALKK